MISGMEGVLSYQGAAVVGKRVSVGVKVLVGVADGVIGVKDGVRVMLGVDDGVSDGVRD